MTEAKTGERTAGPWIIQDERDMTGEIWIGVEHPEVGFVSHASVRSGCGEADELGDMEANAAFIVQACNGFPALTSALEAAYTTMRNAWGAVSTGQIEDKDVEGTLKRGMLEARSALEAALKAEGR